MLGQLLINPLILYKEYTKRLVKARFQYKADAWLISFAVFCRESMGVVVVYLTLLRFRYINGWNMNEMFFLFSLLFLTYSIVVFFFTGLRDFSSLVYSGEFDRYLLRPQGILFQVIVSKADYLASIGHGSLGIILFLKTAHAVGIVWNLPTITYYFAAIIGGVLIQASIFLLFSCSSFWLIKTDNLMNFLFYNTRRFAGYPVSIYPGFIQKLLLFVVPFAFVNYFPAQYFLRKPDLANYWSGYIYLTPIVGLVMFITVYYVWNISLRRYSSTGN